MHPPAEGRRHGAVVVLASRAEREHRERAAVIADAGFADADGARRRELHGEGEDAEKWADHDDGDKRHDEVGHALAEALAGREPRCLDVDEGQARDGAGVDAGSCDVGDAGCEQQVLAAGFEAPRDLLDLLGRESVAAGDQHGVGAGVGEDAGEVVEGAEDGDVGIRRRDARVVVVGREAGSDDEVAGVAALLQFVADLGD